MSRGSVAAAAAAIAKVSLLLVYWCRAACLHRAQQMSNRSIRAQCVNNVWRTAQKKMRQGTLTVFCKNGIKGKRHWAQWHGANVPTIFIVCTL